MNTENTIAPRVDDIVFENRNKAYGAYAIRKEYDTNLSKGSLASFLFVACLFGMTYAAMMFRTEIKKVITEKKTLDWIDGITVIPDKRIQNEIRKQPVSDKSAFPTKVVTQEVANKPIEDTQATTTTTTTTTGDATGVDPVVATGGDLVEPVVTVAPPQILVIAEVMPEFEGGEKALYKFLRKTVRYPEVSKRIGEEGTVYVKFIIDVTGVVTGIEIVKGVSASLDKEALRVISLMPRWKPGTQHGTPVNVKKILPIKFEFNRD